MVREKAVSWDSQNNLAFHWLLATTEPHLRSPEPLKRLLGALVKAEGFVYANEEETKRLIVRHYGFDPAFLNESWPRTKLSVSFGQSIATSLENYARWQMGKEGKLEDFPDVSKYLYTGILDEVAPSEVTIFR